MRAMVVLAVLFAAFAVPNAQAADAKPIRVAVVTGGHAFSEPDFLGLFKSLKGVEFKMCPQKDQSELFENVDDFPYDVIVLYNMTQQISEKRQQNFIKLLDRGVGVVGMHHAFGAWPEWPDYAKILGCRYYRKVTVVDGVTHARSQYKEDVDITYHVVDPENYITKGLKDFTLNDETYKGYTMEPDNTILLTTDHPLGQKEVAWSRTFRNARICTIQAGHGTACFADDSYRTIVQRMIEWTAKRDGAKGK